MHKFKPVIQSKKSRQLSRLLKKIVIVLILLSAILSSSSCASKSNIRPRENCRYEAVTYGDFINCTIKLDELQGVYNGR